MKTLCALITLFSVVLGSLASGAAEVTVNAYSQAWVKGEQARMDELGIVTGTPGPLLESIKSVHIIRVPDAERPVIINREYIGLRLAQSGIDTAGVKIIAPPRITIHRESQLVDAQRINREVERYVKNMMGTGADKAKVEITGIDNDLLLPPGKVAFEVGADTPPKYWGYARVPVTLSVDGVVKKKVWAKVSVSFMEDVVVLSEPVKRGEVITEEMVTVEQRDTLRLKNSVLRDTGEVVGKNATRNLQAGDMLARNAVELPLVIKRGSRVTVVAENNGFRVSILAEAMENGAKGDTIKVKNLDSRKIIQAEVVDESTARALF
ncbi:MAG: flagellar basal body P-ring formation chaperone FlgA [Nitrospirota bacterium]|nr:flagellar basal body P-ring formation chaperone FlgA [Nitrospirota bacterium]